MPEHSTRSPVRLAVTREGTVCFEVHARPRARASRIVGVRGDARVVPLAAPPVEGAANAELLEALAIALSVPKRDVTIAQGEKGWVKLVDVHGLTAAEVRARASGSEATEPAGVTGRRGRPILHVHAANRRSRQERTTSS